MTPLASTVTPGMWLMTSAIERSCFCLKRFTVYDKVSLRWCMPRVLTVTSRISVISSAILILCPLRNVPHPTSTFLYPSIVNVSLSDFLPSAIVIVNRPLLSVNVYATMLLPLYAMTDAWSIAAFVELSHTMP